VQLIPDYSEAVVFEQYAARFGSGTSAFLCVVDVETFLYPTK